jgi:glycosyltransferase involved in cell wall biosynthesis
MPMPLRVSVITPSYNQGRFLERTIQSVLSQQFGGVLEYLVMDGGSQDETVAILRRYGNCLQWVSEKDEGQADAVNKGLARAKGEIIGWLNSDDIYYPGAIRAASDFLACHPEVDAVYGNANHIDEQDLVIEPYPTEDWDFERLKEGCYVCQPSVFFRSSVVQRFGPLDLRLRYCMDYEYWLRLAAEGVRFARIGAVVAGSRLYATNKTLGSRVKVHAEINDMMRDLFTRVPDRWLFNYAHSVLDDRGISRSESLQFPVLVSALSLSAALRWNRHISRSMAGTVCQWLGNAVRDELRAT